MSSDPLVTLFRSPPLLDLDVVTEEEAIERVAEMLERDPAVWDFSRFMQELFERQRINPPLLGTGVALPHARTSAVTEIVCVAARLAKPVAFGPDEIPIRLIFLFGVPPKAISDYLAATAGLVRRLKRPEAMAGLLAAETPDQFSELLTGR